MKTLITITILLIAAFYAYITVYVAMKDDDIERVEGILISSIFIAVVSGAITLVQVF